MGPVGCSFILWVVSSPPGSWALRAAGWSLLSCDMSAGLGSAQRAALRCLCKGGNVRPGAFQAQPFECCGGHVSAWGRCAAQWPSSPHLCPVPGPQGHRHTKDSLRPLPGFLLPQDWHALGIYCHFSSVFYSSSYLMTLRSWCGRPRLTGRACLCLLVMCVSSP